MFSAVVGISAFALVALAQDSSISFTTNPPSTINAPTTINLPYSAPANGGAVTITLLTGCPSNCVPDQVLTSSGTAGTGSYSWNVDSSVAAGTSYGLKISQGDVFNYSNNFAVAGGSSSSSSAPSSSSASPVKTIGDGQPQAATSAAAVPVSQIGDNQPQAPTSAPAAAYGSAPAQMSSVISSAAAAMTSYAAAGPAASYGASSSVAKYTPTPVATPAAGYTGAASNNKVGAGLMGLAGVAGAFALL